MLLRVLLVNLTIETYKYKLVNADGSEMFENDAQADGYKRNEFGSENSVLNVLA